MHTAAATLATLPEAAVSRAATASPGLPSSSAAVPRGRVHSVFWRIFLWFWLAMLLLATAVTATVYITDPDQFFPRLHYVPLRRIDELARSGSALYEQQGPAALGRFLERAGRIGQAGTEDQRIDGVYLFDAASGRELAGRTAPEPTQEIVARARASDDLQVEHFFTRLVMARREIAAGGQTYVLLVTLPRPSAWLPTAPQFWLRLGAAILVSALVCYWLARYLLEPVRRLQAATRRLAAGDLSARVLSTPASVRRRDEFSELARDFDEMAFRIENLLSAQRRLIADISHELGSPLTRVNVALRLAFRKANPEVQPELNRIEREAGRVNELIRQLLLLAELENRAEAESLGVVDLPALVGEIAADAEFEAGSRACRVRVESTPAQVRGVAHLLRSALENVVRNAVRYTEPDSEVFIEIGQAAGRAFVRVRDHGPGVPAEALEHLFRPFYRVSEARDRQSGGTGLGLAIAQQAVAAHGGAIRARNHPEGGLVVEVELGGNDE